MVDPNKGFSVGPYSTKGRENLIGRGSFANVYKGWFNSNQIHLSSDPHNIPERDVVAIKVVDIDRLTRGNEKLREHLDSEIKIMKDLSHSNIVKLYDVFTLSDSHMVMIFEYCEGGDLSKYISKNQKLSESKAQKFMIQLAKALRFLRTKNIIHRDLKPQNILLSSKGDDSQLKIADFGFARFIEPQSVADTLCGSPLYMAPEILKMQKYTIKADLWSVGMILYEMLVGMPPFLVKSHIELVRVIDSQPITLPQNIKANISPMCQNLILSLLEKDPITRISWEEFFLHPWISLINLDAEDHQSLQSNTTAPISISNIIPSGRISEGKEDILIDQQSSLYSVINKPNSRRGTNSDERPFEITSISTNHNEEMGRHQTIIHNLEIQSKRAFAVLSFADIRAQSNFSVDAFVLYMKGLSLLRSILSNSIQTQQSSYHPHASSSFRSLLAVDINHYREAFREYLKKADYLRQSLQSNDVTLPPEKLLYDFAIHLGNEGALSEGLEKYEKAKKLYENGLLIMEQLENEAVAGDKIILRKFIRAFLQRLEVCQEDQSIHFGR